MLDHAQPLAQSIGTSALLRARAEPEIFRLLPYSLERAARRRDLDVKALGRQAGLLEGAGALADVLARCSPRKPCGSGACFHCVTRLQGVVCAAAAAAFSDHPKARWSVVDIVPTGKAHAIRYGRCATRELLTPTATRVEAMMQREGLAGFGAIDISANEHEEGDFPSHFRVHARLLVEGGREDVLVRLKPYAKKNRVVRRPLMVQVFDGDLRAVAYCVKPNFDMRTSLVRKRSREGKLIGPSTRKKNMRESERVELYVALHKEAISRRILMQGYTFRLIDDQPRLVRTGM